MTIKTLYQLVDIPDYKYSNGEESNIDYSSVATDCNTKTISILQAIFHMSEKTASLAQSKKVDVDNISQLCGIISDLSELAIATNKISESANYSCAYKDAKNAK